MLHNHGDQPASRWGGPRHAARPTTSYMYQILGTKCGANGGLSRGNHPWWCVPSCLSHQGYARRQIGDTWAGATHPARWWDERNHQQATFFGLSLTRAIRAPESSSCLTRFKPSWGCDSIPDPFGEASARYRRDLVLPGGLFYRRGDGRGMSLLPSPARIGPVWQPEDVATTKSWSTPGNAFRMVRMHTDRCSIGFDPVHPLHRSLKLDQALVAEDRQLDEFVARRVRS